jgi:mannose-6-phosphate isomerase
MFVVFRIIYMNLSLSTLKLHKEIVGWQWNSGRGARNNTLKSFLQLRSESPAAKLCWRTVTSVKIMVSKKIEERPWGRFEQFVHNEPCSVKLLYVKASSRLSLQYHNRRKEFWKVIRGPVDVQIGDDVITGNEGDEFEIPVGVKHRLQGLSSHGIILEISFGDFDEQDIVRLDDDFGRAR